MKISNVELCNRYECDFSKLRVRVKVWMNCEIDLGMIFSCAFE